MPLPARILVLAGSDGAMAAHAAPGHPERPERLEPVLDGIADGAAHTGAKLVREAAEPAADADLLRVHPQWHVRRLEDAAAGGGGWIDADTYLAPESMDAARLAAGATIRAALAAATGEATVAFAAVRPPGHHASAERAAGFCLLNNVALAAARLRADGLAERLAILDWDVHHGDGTQAIFDADPDVFYASTHQSPLYPGTGEASERGTGEARGTKRNVPLPPGTGDDAFSDAWRSTLLPEVEAFAPEAILLSAGFDAHRDDPLAHLLVTEAGYRAVARAIGGLAARCRVRGVAVTLEGGYDLAALRHSAAATVAGIVEGFSGGSGSGS
jgi:acetoin utilization deacetylase AcuC-like enzyme